MLRPEAVNLLMRNGYSQQTAQNRLIKEWSSITHNALSYINRSLRKRDSDLVSILSVSAYDLPLNLSPLQVEKLREALSRACTSPLSMRYAAFIQMRSIQAGEAFPAGSPAEDLYQAIINWKKLRPY